MSHAALHPARPAHSRPHRPRRTTQRWTVGVLALATAAAGGYVALLVTATWLFASAWSGLTRDPVAVDVLPVAADVAPVLLVGWCTGLAASAVLARGEALGARTAGVTAGVRAPRPEHAVLALTGLL